MAPSGCGNPEAAIGVRPDARPNGVAYGRDLMNGYDMNGWGWIGMTMMVIVTLTLVGLFVWATTARRSREPQNCATSAFKQLDPLS